MFAVIRFNRFIEYENGLELQKKAFELVREDKFEGILLVLEHAPVLTIGSNGGANNILESSEALADKNIGVYETRRGGNVTFHGPGQIIAYPIFNLEKLNKDAHWFMDCMESTAIKTLAKYNLQASKKPKYRGVWVGDEKIVAVGLQIRKWITMHGMALNVNVDKRYFDMINPCGITEFGVASLEDFKPDADIESVKTELIRSFENVFNIELIEAQENLLEV